MIEPGWIYCANPMQRRLFEAIGEWLSTDTDASSDHLFMLRQQAVLVRAERYALSQGWLPPEEPPAPPARPLPGQLALPFGQVVEVARPRRARAWSRHPLEATYGSG